MLCRKKQLSPFGTAETSRKENITTSPFRAEARGLSYTKP